MGFVLRANRVLKLVIAASLAVAMLAAGTPASAADRDYYRSSGAGYDVDTALQVTGDIDSIRVVPTAVPSSAATAGANLGDEAATVARRVLDALSDSPRRVAPRTAHAPSTDSADYAIVAANSIHLKRDTSVSGSVAVNGQSSGVTLKSPHELALDRSAIVAGDAAGDSVFQDRNSTVTGSVFNNELVQRSGATGASVAPLALPVVALPTFLAADARPGVDNVSVGVGAVVTLPPGTYGHVTVASAGTLLLTGGIYDFRSLTVGGGLASVAAQAAADVRVVNRVNLGATAHFGPASGAAIGAANLILHVGGTNAVPGNPSSLPAAAALGQASTFHGTLYAPNGTVAVGQNSDVTGALFGRDVMIDRDASVTLVPFVGIGNQPPTADGQTVYTEGAASIEILLTGSDPEFENLEFDIVSGPSAGSLGPIVPVVPDPIPNPEPPPADVQPPIVSATVTYTPTNPGDEAVDAFTFKVTDPEGSVATAVVSINPLDDVTPPGTVEQVSAANIELEALPATPHAVDLASGVSAPADAVLTFTVQTLPAGTLSDGSGVISSVPHVLAGSTVTYTAPTEGSTDSFAWGVAGDIGGSASASVLVTISAPPDLAPDATVNTNRNTPVKFTLPANPGGSGQATGTPDRVARNSGVRGASIAGNVSDATDDGLGDGRDNLPGPAPVLVAAGVDVNLGATPSGSVTDPTGDSSGPDLVGATVSSDGTNLVFDVTFAAGTFNSSTSRGSFVLDIDENPATGFPGVDSGNNDSALMGVEYLVNIGANLGANAEVLEFVALPNSFTNVGSFAATVNTDGYTVSIPLATLGGDDGRTTFKVETQTYLGPGFTGILDYMPNLGLAPGQSRTGIQGVARVEIEWDISDLTDAESIESAVVTLSTQKGTVDILDTYFFAGTADQDGVLSVSDFQTPAGQIAGVVMPVPAGPTGTEGTFSFNVTPYLKVAVDAGFDFFTIQARVNEDLAGGGFQRGLQIRSTADGNLTSGKEPKLDIVIGAPPTTGLVWTVTSLPVSGTLKNTLGAPITVGQSFTTAPLLVYQPTAGFVGTATFNYSVAEGTIADVGLISIEVGDAQGCIPVGRPPECAP